MFDDDDTLWDEEVVEERLGSDFEFAQRYYALVSLYRTAAPDENISEIVREIVADEPMLHRRIQDSDRAARDLKVKQRFQSRIQLGHLRRLAGSFRAFPEVLPEGTSSCDRIFPQFDTVSWTLIEGEPTRRYFYPACAWLTKLGIAAMLRVRESSVDAFMRDRFLRRIPPDESPLRGIACFWTSDVMEWRRMQVAMRTYQPPSDIIRGRKFKRRGS